LLGIVLEGGENTTIVLAITLKVDVTLVGRAVMSVDEVKCLGISTPICVANRVCPGCYLRQVVCLIIIENILEVSLSGVCDKVTGEVSGGDMTETCDM
jgi:hypothetical protein